MQKSSTLEGHFFSLYKKSHKVHFHNGLLKSTNFKSTDTPWKLTTNKGYTLSVPQKIKVTTPLHIHFSFDHSFNPSFNQSQGINTHANTNANTSAKTNANTTGEHCLIQNRLTLEEGAEITLIESFSLSSPSMVQIETNLKCAHKANLNWLNWTQEEEGTKIDCKTEIELDSSALLTRLGLGLGGGVSSDKVRVQDSPDGSRCVLLGLSLLKNQAYRNQEFRTRHAKKGGYSRQIFRGLLNDRAKSVFRAHITVLPQAVGTNCAQSANHFLLSEQAISETLPEMEIQCGEVQAQHGAVTGQLNSAELFYLNSRGLDTHLAFEMLVMAHIKEILANFPAMSLRQNILQNLEKHKKNYLNLLTAPPQTA